MPVKCRKCGGDHFTSKCGKTEQKPKLDNNKKPEFRDNNLRNKRRSRFNKDLKKKFNNYSDPNEKVYKAKIYNIPNDLTLQNLNKMMLGWGKVGNINLKQKSDNPHALVDFYDVKARDYFIEAINGTPLGHMMLHVTK